MKTFSQKVKGEGGIFLGKREHGELCDKQSVHSRDQLRFAKREMKPNKQGRNAARYLNRGDACCIFIMNSTVRKILHITGIPIINTVNLPEEIRCGLFQIYPFDQECLLNVKWYVYGY